MPDNTYAIYTRRDNRIMGFIDADSYEIAFNLGILLYGKNELIYVMENIEVIIEV